MKRNSLLAIALSAGALAFATASFATGPSFGTYGKVDKCFGRHLTPDQVIAGCQSAILSGLLTRNDVTSAYQNMGVAYMKKDDYDQALKAFDYAIKWTPSLWQAYANRGKVYAHMDRLDDAFADYNKAIELKSDEPVLYLRRGLAYEQASRNADAMADFNKALQIDQSYAPALEDRGELKRQMGDTAGGDTDIEAAKALEAK